MLRFIDRRRGILGKSILSFRTLYVEVYPFQYSRRCSGIKRFRTLYVEVYRTACNVLPRTRNGFRTLYVEVYRSAGKKVLDFDAKFPYIIC